MSDSLGINFLRWYEIWVRVHFLFLWVTRLTPFVERTVVSSINYLGNFVKTLVNLYEGVSFSRLCYKSVCPSLTLIKLMSTSSNQIP